MTSFDKRMANRANAAQSTGPKTLEGMKISRSNALSHGFTASTLLIEGEDEELFTALRLAWMRHWSGEYYELSGYEKSRTGTFGRMQKFHQGLEFSRKKRSGETNQKLLLGRMLHEEMSHNLMAKLSRYESHLLNQLRRAHADLLAQQSRRITRKTATSSAVNDEENLETAYETNAPPARPRVHQL
ncbi:MAG: hypothetical protein GY947_23525 [Rhodobacteraceae bacterium]|nr:hypothetical protein [Paracoccaceae bacterium]